MAETLLPHQRVGRVDDPSPELLALDAIALARGVEPGACRCDGRLRRQYSVVPLGHLDPNRVFHQLDVCMGSLEVGLQLARAAGCKVSVLPQLLTAPELRRTSYLCAFGFRKEGHCSGYQPSGS